MSWTERTQLLLGTDGLEKLANSKVLIFGVGGVGGYVAEMLARTGVGNLTLVDFDVVSESNLNRQIIALNSTIGQPKAVVMKNRIEDINPNCKVTINTTQVNPRNVDSYNLQSYDFVVDCIDMLYSKMAIMEYCFKNGVKLVSSMGAGNKRGIPNFKVCDIFETQYDGLSRVIRKKLKKRGVINSTVVCTDEQSVRSMPVGSIAFYPACCACVVAGYVVNELTK